MTETSNFIVEQKRKESLLHRPGIGPGPPAWQASILPLNHRCAKSIVQSMFNIPSSCIEMKNRFGLIHLLRPRRILSLYEAILNQPNTTLLKHTSKQKLLAKCKNNAIFSPESFDTIALQKSQILLCFVPRSLMKTYLIHIR